MPTYPETPLYRSIISGDFPVIVSLARHDLDLAKAALDGGAGAIKVHLNAFHRASGTTFGSFTEERPFLEALAKLGAPICSTFPAFITTILSAMVMASI